MSSERFGFAADLARDDQRRALAFAGLIIGLYVVLRFVPQGELLVAILCGAVALISTPSAVGAIIMLLMLRVANPGLVSPENGSFEVFAWGAMILASMRIWLDIFVKKISFSRRLPSFLWLYALVLLPLSVLFSELPSVSFIKATTFLFVMSSIVLGFDVMRETGRPASSWIKGMWLCVIMLSLPTLVVPAIGYLRDGQGFQGVLNHPQGFAVFLAPIVIWSLVQALTSDGRTRGRVLVIGLLLTSLAFLWLTRGRTGFAAILLGALLLAVLRPGLARKLLDMGAVALTKPWVLAGLVLTIPIALWQSAEIISGIQEFLFKKSGADALSGAFAASRGFIADQQIINFQNSPIVGIGFGVSNSTTHALNVVIDPITGLPVGAATEKANLFLAVIEETGIIGALAFAPFLLFLAYRMARSHDLGVAWAGMAALATNASEMTFFSFGGVGLYTWLIMAWALSEYPRARRDALAPRSFISPGRLRSSTAV